MPTHDDPAYLVGYGKPPRHTRFRKGQSGNPKGRPAGTRNLATLVEQTLDEPVVINENGRRKTIRKREALVKLLTNKAVAGDQRAFKLLLEILRTRGGGSDSELPSADSDDPRSATLKPHRRELFAKLSLPERRTLLELLRKAQAQ